MIERKKGVIGSWERKEEKGFQRVFGKLEENRTESRPDQQKLFEKRNRFPAANLTSRRKEGGQGSCPDVMGRLRAGAKYCKRRRKSHLQESA